MIARNTKDSESLEPYPEALTERVRIFVYQYQSGQYDGNGESLVLLKNGLWHRMGLGHCSCYGPLDEQNLSDLNCDGYSSLEELKSHWSPELVAEMTPIYDIAKVLSMSVEPEAKA